MKKALVYRRGGLGDTLLTFPILEILKKKGYHVTMIGNRDYIILAKHTGWADRILGEIPQEEFDKKILIGINGTVNLLPEKRKWIVEHYLSQTELFGYDYSRILPLEDTYSKLSDKILFYPSSGSKKKNLPERLIIKIIRLLNNPVVVAGEADEWLRDIYDDIFILDKDIIRTASILRSARLFIGADSGLSHLSSYLGVKTMIIYGPTDPVIWKPIGRDILEIRPSLCPPCFPLTCKSRECLEDENIHEEILQRLRHELLT